ncbi:MAG: leucine-rich repeat domain-containing protein [Bacteroidales bacterium]|nr:leucine-rich repeat domain-containing protein [Bacteroidales bacterium]
MRTGEYIVPEGTKEIGKYAFSSCSGMKRVVIPEGVEKIGEMAFYDCWDLESVEIPSTVSEIDGSAFWYGPHSDVCEYWRKLKSIKVAEGNKVYDSREGCNAIIETATGTLIVGCKTTVIPDGVKVIGERAFSSVDIRRVEIPDSVKMISSLAFTDCHRLKTIVIGAGVEKIGVGAFEGCDRGRITVAKGNKVYDSREDCNGVIETATGTMVLGSRNTVIPKGVKAIGDSVFMWNSPAEVVIPDGVEWIGGTAFAEGGLRKIVLPKSVKELGFWVFAGRDSLKEIWTDIENPTDSDFGQDRIRVMVPKGTVEKYRKAWGEENEYVEM